MNRFKKSIFAALAVVAGISLTAACSDANEFEDTNTDPLSFVKNYNDTLSVAHPASLASTTWLRAAGMYKNVHGDEVQGFIESLKFVSEDSVAVKMSEGILPGKDKEIDYTFVYNWVDESNTESTPYYEYTYSANTGRIEILKRVVDDKGKVSKSAIFTGVAVSSSQEIITMTHFGDTPVQTYLVRQ